MLKTLLTTGEGFNPIGTTLYTEAEVSGINIFKGTFDGNNKAIYDLYINKDIVYVSDQIEQFIYGLFGYNYGKIMDLSLINVNLENSKNSTDSYVFIGGIAGINKGNIDNCYVDGEIKNNDLAGGIVARNSITITDCINGANVEGAYRVGGICADGNGSDNSKIINCGNIGNIINDIRRI